MTPALPAAAEAEAFRALADCAAEVTGFSGEAILPDAIRRVLRDELAEGRSAAEVCERARLKPEALVHALQQAVSVGETYFFRHPEQFAFIVDEVLGSRANTFERPFRAWSAGCATGEETYSIAACLLAKVGAGSATVLGTDLLERNVRAARVGVYGRWSVRSSGPTLFPLHEPAGPDKVRVSDEVRALVTFESRNLLDDPPGAAGSFDLVLCRNVLVYFSPAAGREVTARIAAALAPGGYALFGPMDVSAPPPGMVRVGPPELQVFRRVAEDERPRPAPARPPVRLAPLPPPPAVVPAAPVAPPEPPRAPAPVTRAPPAKTEPVAVHLRALALIDRGDDAQASALLDALCEDAPEYVPGLIERALLHLRQGAVPLAQKRMRDVLRLTVRLPADQILAAPEPLPVQFYADSAEAFLERHERRSGR
jgi:chemotaxis protein methyltransferase CheR